MSGGSKQEQLEHRLDHKLNASSDGIDMDVPAKVISSETVYTGRIFHVDDMRIALTDKQGKEHEIGRQVLRHAPCVVMLVHDMSTDQNNHITIAILCQKNRLSGFMHSL